MQTMKATIIALSVFLIAGNLIAGQATQATELKNISFAKKDNQIEVRIEYPVSIPYDSFSLMNPNRLVLDFMGISAVSSLPMIAINDMGIESIRSALNRPGVARVVFNFTDEIPQYRIEETESGLVINFWKEERVAAPEEPKEVTQEKPETEEPVLTETTYAEEGPAKKMALGFSLGYLAFQDEAFKDSYGGGGMFFKGEYSLILPVKVESFDIWTGFTYFEKAGKTSITQEDLTLRITDLSVAVRYLLPLSKFTPFAGIGINYIVYKEILPEGYLIGSVGGSDLGFHIQGGTYFDALPNLSLKVHIKYLSSKTDVDGIEVNLGGVEYGAGLVFRFNL